jgi:segregation and condensation protein B
VNSDGVLRALQDRGLITETGREQGPGRPMLYGTSAEFLERLGLPSLSALPSLAPLLGADPTEDAADGVADPTAGADEDSVIDVVADETASERTE